MVSYDEVVFEKLKEPLPNTDKDDPCIDSRKEKALKRAWVTRNFEIELYWKRALYFWGFIVVAAGGYAKSYDTDYALLIACIGLVFSVAWFLVNKASKFWQENWECHIDLLEDDVEGKIYKTVLKNKTSFLLPTKAYYFSVSKINQAINVFVILVWLFLALRHSKQINLNYFNFKNETIILILTGFMLLWLLAYCRTSFKEEKKKSLWARIRCLFIEKYKFESLDGCKYTYYDRKTTDD